MALVSSNSSIVTPRPERVYGTCNHREHLYTKRLFSAIEVFLEVVIKDKIVKFSKNCGTFVIKESGGGESTNLGILKDNNIN